MATTWTKFKVRLYNSFSPIQLNPNQWVTTAFPAAVNTYWRVSKSIAGLSLENICSGTFCASQMPNRKLLAEVCGNATSFRYTHRKHPPHVSRPVIANWLDSHVIYQTLSGTYIVTSIFAFLCQKLSDWGHIVFFPLNPPTCLCLTLRHCWSNSSMLFFFLGGVADVANWNPSHWRMCQNNSLYNRM